MRSPDLATTGGKVSTEDSPSAGWIIFPIRQFSSQRLDNLEGLIKPLHVPEVLGGKTAPVAFRQSSGKLLNQSLAVVGPLLVLLHVHGDDAPHIPVEPDQRQVRRGDDVLARRLDQRLNLRQHAGEARQVGLGGAAFAESGFHVREFLPKSAGRRRAAIISNAAHPPSQAERRFATGFGRPAAQGRRQTGAPARWENRRGEVSSSA
jgi:hypothetical protein